MATDVISIGMRRDEVIDRIDLLGVEIGDDLTAVLSPVTSVDQDRLTGWRDDEGRIALSNIDVVNFEFTVNRTLVDVIALVVVAALYIAVRLIEINIADFDQFVDSVRNDRRALRKMREIKRVGIYSDLSRDEVEQIVSDFNLSIDVEEGDGDEDWAIASSDLRKKWDIIRLLNDDHLYSDLSKDRYQVYGKNNRS